MPLDKSEGGVKDAPALDGVHFLYDETAGFSALMNMFDRDPAAKLEERTWAGNKQWTMWARRRTLFVEILKQVRQRYGLVVVGYVVMPEHFHIMISEPERGNPSTVMQVLKQRFARKVLKERRKRDECRPEPLWADGLSEGHVWQRLFYDFVVWTRDKRVEKLRYMHGNPVKRGLVLEPEQWSWSSYRHYAHGESGHVLINETQPAPMRVRRVAGTDVAAGG